MRRLTHIAADGRAQMVDVSAKPLSARTAVATGKIRLRRETLDLISKDQITKGNVFAAARTGVEMEALTGVATALLTIYDMCKAIDKEMQLSGIRLVKKTKQEL